MTKKSMTGWFGKHLVEVAVGLLVLCTLAAWTDLRSSLAETARELRSADAAIRMEMREDYAAKADVTKVLASLDTIANRLLDIGDRLARIEGEMKGVSGGGGVRP